MTEPADACFVCSKQRGEVDVPGGVLYEDDLVYASHGVLDSHHGYPGLLFVEPKRHAPGFPDLTTAEAERVGLLIHRLSRALEAVTDAERTYVAVLGHHVPHLHVWLVPRYPGTPAELWGTDVLRWDDAPVASYEEIAALCQRIRERLQEN